MQKQGLYVHIPFCRSRCSYCGFVSCTDICAAEKCVGSLVSEMRERAGGEADTVYIGGGTPSVLPRGLLTKIFGALRENFAISENAEITAEANPDSCDSEFLHEARACGINRLSLGVQTLNDCLLARIGRRHNAEQAYRAVRSAQKAGITNIGCDLMLALPEQTEKDVVYAVDTLASWGVKHISAYSLSVEKETALYNSGYAPDEDRAADMYEAAYGRLKAHGFERYEVSNFCKAGYQSRHNLKYWRLEPYAGLGAAAHSYNGTVRSRNTSNISEYISGRRGEVCEQTSMSEKLEEYIMLGLRTKYGVEFSKLNALFGGDWLKAKAREISELCEGGYIRRSERGITLTEKAYFVMNSVILRLI